MSQEFYFCSFKYRKSCCVSVCVCSVCVIKCQKMLQAAGIKRKNVVKFTLSVTQTRIYTQETEKRDLLNIL